MDRATTGDDVYMRHALRLGRRALGTTAENPPVGCVIVKDDRIVGLGWTQAGGRPHAETEALAMAGEEARGATAYVTLEPCAHRGRTGPCAEALRAAGIAQVATAMEDPDSRVKGKGHALLRAAGIAVATGLCADEARRDLRGFLTRIVKHRPQVIIKLAVSADGKIAAGPRQRTAITGEEVCARVHLMRAQSDAVLVGLGTVLSDDPELTCRLPGLEARSPIRVVADSRLSIPPHAKLMKSASTVPLWLLATRRSLADSGVTVIHCRDKSDGWIDFTDALERLAERGINRLLVEGGAHVARSFLDSDLVDETHIFTAPHGLGPGGIEALAGLPLSLFETGWTVLREERLGPDRLTVYENSIHASSSRPLSG